MRLANTRKTVKNQAISCASQWKSLLPPPSPLMAQLSATKPQQPVVSATNSIQAKAIASKPQQQAAQVNPLNSLPSIPPLQLQPAPLRVIPATAPPSSGAILDSFISSNAATLPNSRQIVQQQQQQRPIGWSVPNAQPIAQAFATPPSQQQASSSTVFPPQQNAHNFDQKLQHQQQTNLGPSQELISQVKSKAAFATASDIKAALTRNQMNAEAAIRQLKTQQLLSLNITKDAARVYSALDHCSWNLDEAASQLLASN